MENPRTTNGRPYVFLTHIKEKIPPRLGWDFLAEEKGFEPLQRFHALRDFESRLFDQLEYSSVTD